jgi:hypothetical protein
MVDIFVVKLNPSGGYVWGRQIGNPNDNDGANGVAMDASGNVIVTGTVIADVDFGGGSLAALGSSDAFVAKYAAANGNHLWSRRVGGMNNDYGAAVAVDAAGNVAIAGSFEGSALFGGLPLNCLGIDDAYVLKLDSTGKPTWVRQLGGTNSDIGLTLAFAPSGSIVTGGYFYGAGTFGGFPLTSVGAADAFIASLAP